jgi:hypothetical protein
MKKHHHTPGPWVIYNRVNIDAADLSICRASPENAARIVECVNACEGIENPAAALEAARTALKDAFDYIDLDILPDGSCPAAANSTMRAINKALAALGAK